MKKIAVITATRAEFGLLRPVINALRMYESDKFIAELIVTGTHLSPKFGMTINEIKNCFIRIDHEIQIPVESCSSIDISRNQAQALVKFTECFALEHYSALIILGDRYEMLAAAIAANNTHTPIFHISGGDITEGAIDEYIRHSITKMSFAHFATNEASKNRILQMGENPELVFNYGSTSIDNILNTEIFSKQVAMQNINITNESFAICTYHPTTLEHRNLMNDMNEIFCAIKYFSHIDFIFTKSNADMGGEMINSILDDATQKISNLKVFDSLGTENYLALVKYSTFVLGNSSSGIIEAPALHVPTINLGSRQRGRLQALSIINCECNNREIIAAINLALTPSFRTICTQVKSPYGRGNSAEKIAAKSIELINGNIDLRKQFYDYQEGFVS